MAPSADHPLHSSCFLPQRNHSTATGASGPLRTAVKMWMLACLIWLALFSMSLCTEDYYKLLGVDKNASEKLIKRAYRTQSKKYHPDKNPYVGCLPNP